MVVELVCSARASLSVVGNMKRDDAKGFKFPTTIWEKGWRKMAISAVRGAGDAEDLLAQERSETTCPQALGKRHRDVATHETSNRHFDRYHI